MRSMRTTEERGQRSGLGLGNQARGSLLCKCGGYRACAQLSAGRGRIIICTYIYMYMCAHAVKGIGSRYKQLLLLFLVH